MKIDSRFGSIWDELPRNSELKSKRIPTTQQEAQELYEAAESSTQSSTLKAWDSHNDMVAKSNKLRQIKQRKDIIERRNIEHREEQTKLIEEAVMKRKN